MVTLASGIRLESCLPWPMGYDLVYASKKQNESNHTRKGKSVGDLVNPSGLAATAP